MTHVPHHYVDKRAFLELVRDAGLSEPEVNAPIAGCVVDLLWRDKRLAVETDGFAVHGTRRAFERDRRRDIDLALAELRVHRFTHAQVARSPGETRRRLARLHAAQ